MPWSRIDVTLLLLSFERLDQPSQIRLANIASLSSASSAGVVERPIVRQEVEPVISGLDPGARLGRIRKLLGMPRKECPLRVVAPVSLLARSAFIPA